MMQKIIERFPGLGYARIDAAGIETAAYYGCADRERRIPADESTVFPACSISKFITAICVMKLQECGMLAIDAPVNRFLRVWKLRTAEGEESDASIRSLLCHTAGISDGEDAFFGLRRSDPEISLADILEGKTAYNDRPTRAEKPQGTAFAYSDAGYCVLQKMLEDLTGKSFDGLAKETVFDALGLENTFFASPQNAARFENRMAACYDEDGARIPGKFPYIPDLAASGLWSTPKELLAAAKEFVRARLGKSTFLRESSAKEMAEPAAGFPWTGLGVFTDGADTLFTQGWGEHGQCILKMNCRTGAVFAVMTNRNPGVDQKESGLERLADSMMH